MSLEKKLAALFSEIVKEVKANPQFAARLGQVLDVTEKAAQQPGTRSNRRAPAALDPFEEYKKGESLLRERLSGLNVDQLRDVVAQYGMDRSKLAMKWKDPQRLIDLITSTVVSRLRQGDVFLAPGGSSADAT